MREEGKIVRLREKETEKVSANDIFYTLQTQLLQNKSAIE